MSDKLMTCLWFDKGQARKAADATIEAAVAGQTADA